VQIIKEGLAINKCANHFYDSKRKAIAIDNQPLFAGSAK
jgi:hypothetical protein